MEEMDNQYDRLKKKLISELGTAGLSEDEVTAFVESLHPHLERVGQEVFEATRVVVDSLATKASEGKISVAVGIRSMDFIDVGVGALFNYFCKLPEKKEFDRLVTKLSSHLIAISGK